MVKNIDCHRLTCRCLSYEYLGWHRSISRLSTRGSSSKNTEPGTGMSLPSERYTPAIYPIRSGQKQQPCFFLASLSLICSLPIASRFFVVVSLFLSLSLFSSLFSMFQHRDSSDITCGGDRTRAHSTVKRIKIR